MNNFLLDLALAHKAHEGWYPGSISFRQNNPGNLVFSDIQHTFFGAKPGEQGFAIFPNYNIGITALMSDLKAKITGIAGSVKHYEQKFHKSYLQLTFLDYVKIYAPSGDNNKPVKYCDALCANLSHYNVHPETPLAILTDLIKGTIDHAPDVPLPLVEKPEPIVPLIDAPSTIVPPIAVIEERVANLERRFSNEKNPILLLSIKRAIQRLSSFFHIS